MARTVDALAVPGRTTTIYPEAFKHLMRGRTKCALTEPLGLTQFGVNLTILEPGARSALRHWHAQEDECIFVLSGELVLVTNAGETLLRAGQAAGFPAGDADGHCLINKGAIHATYLEIGTRSPTEHVEYPDDDLVADKVAGQYRFTRKDGTAYP